MGKNTGNSYENLVAKFNISSFNNLYFVWKTKRDFAITKAPFTHPELQRHNLKTNIHLKTNIKQ
jgi:hypothetical protein